MKNSLMFVIVAAALEVSAYNVGGIVGAWAPEGGVGTSAVVVVEHHVVWGLEGGYWRPFRLGELEQGDNRAGATLIPFGKSTKPAFFIAKDGGGSDRAVFGVWTDSGKGTKQKALVRTDAPDWDKVCGSSGFVGTWVEEKPSYSALIVRADGTAAVVPIQEDAADKTGWERSVEFDWKRDCAGIRLFPRENAELRRFGLPEPGVMALRPGAKSADIMCPFGFSGVAVRSAEKVPDPLEKRRKMAAEASYHGIWSSGDRKSGYSFYISPKGRGILVSMKLGPENLLPFDWKAADGGKLHCAVFPDFASRAKCPFNEFDFVYYPVPNEIELIISSDTHDGVVRTRLQLYNWNEMVDIAIEELQKGKASKDK